MKAIQIFKDGSYETVDLTKEYLLDQYPLFQRDLRPIVLIKQTPTIFEREGVVIVNLGFMRLFITKEFAYVFNTRHRYVSEVFLEDIVARLHDEEGAEKRSPFEFKILESALHVKLDKLSNDYMQLEKDVTEALEKLRHKLSEENFEQLLITKNRLSRIETQIKQLEEMLDDSLKDQDEMRSFSLSKRASKTLEEEIESIFEHYYEQVNDLWNNIDDLRENIEDNQNIMTLKLSNVRNTIIQFDLIISIFTAAFGIPAIVVGLFGMNVINGIEQSPDAFWIIIWGSIISLVLVMGISLILMRRKNIL